MPSETPPTIAVIGLGYIGLPTAAVVARTGAQVRGVDVSAHVVETVSAGRVHIEENDLDALVQAVVANGTLTASLDMPRADVFVIAVPTPFKEGFAPDISYVEAAARAVAPMLERGNTVILESTSPVGTTETIRDILAGLRPDLTFPHASGDDADIAVAYCPERVLPGRILEELVSNDRCIGGISNACATRALGFYQRFVKGDCLLTTARTAEMVKLVENAFRDVNIAFANELSVISHGLDLDVWEVIRLANRHPRVNILQPGPGVGGHCIAVDPWFIVHSDPQNARLIRTAREVNDDKIDFTIARAVEQVERGGDAPIAVLGLAFKPNIDDLRSSPAVEVALRLAARYGSRVRIVEPYIDALPAAFADSGATLVSLDAALDSCGSAILLVDHDAFKALDQARLASLAVHDSRGIWRN
ncbi:UDP-N-acetyl-D-mannosamine dehydrogenase [Sphingomonas sp.]|jgi:UDP-N-acetyl-D-mannosaminuronic acid dehydrogenase|uniref:UDP-N-acetyl-D-mannosamine dehydrogenase n=1 Tax=Sphingomonas sp. TaxID=28214 RepID=UPI002E0DFDF8|nr:UDP-N-acetyl-D-mannosamine dehydrogenase [Sphingomonas sp.]HEV7287997.1 UDP-N-acetyl-D-mannosamine dehydrogenase [Sphingomonas sp.]